MHRIFPIQKRVVQVNLSYFNSTVIQPVSLTSFPFSTATKRKEIQGSLFPVQKSLYGSNGRFGWRKKGNSDSFLKAVLSSDSTTHDTTVRLQNDSNENESKQQSDSNFDTLGAWDNRIDLPIMMDESIKHGTPIPRVTAADVGCSTILGKRIYQEDR